MSHTVRMPGAAEMEKGLVRVNANPYLKVRVYAELIERLAGRTVNTEALVAAFIETVRELIAEGGEAAGLLLSPFVREMDKYVAAITPAGQVLNDARSAMRAGIRDGGL